DSADIGRAYAAGLPERFLSLEPQQRRLLLGSGLMVIALDALRAYRTRTEHRYTRKDVMLYALGVGLGANEEDLPFVYEQGLQVLPTFGGVLGYPGFWIKEHPELGID